MNDHFNNPWEDEKYESAIVYHKNYKNISM